MAVNATHSSFFNGTNPISFRSLQTTFGGSANNVKLSTYKRDTSLNNANPTVPDATENANINTTNFNLNLSAYRGSIKEYILQQTGTDVNLTFEQDAYSASSHHWNSNLNKNVIKKFQVFGTVGGNSTTTPALKFVGSAYNLSLDVNGGIFGKRGTGGTNGNPGGTAFKYFSNASTSFNTANFHARIKGPVYGGGGGGGKGRSGNSNNANCYFSSENETTSNARKQSSNTVCASTRCPSNATSRGISGNLGSTGSCSLRGSIGSERDRRRRRRGGWDGWGRDNRNRDRRDVKGRGCHGRARANDCWNDANKGCQYNHNYNISANGGNGGNGGNGYGFSGSNVVGANSGNSGNSGNTTNCSRGGSGSTTGNSGTSGGSGGGPGRSGGSGSNSGGNAGHSIKGRRISFNGNSYIKGPLKDL